jgi:hypothetical protein
MCEISSSARRLRHKRRSAEDVAANKQVLPGVRGSLIFSRCTDLAELSQQKVP